MRGFYSHSELKRDISPSNPTSCASCGLYRNVRTPRMKPHGKFRKKVLLVGEAPDEVSDRRGRPWQGRLGRDLQETFKEKGFNIGRDALSTYCCNCRTPKGRKPEPNEVSCCRKSLLQTIRKYKPEIIILIGGTATESLIGRSWKKKLGGIQKWRGWTIPDREHNAWICPIYHPSFVGKKEERGNKNLARLIWEQDIERALSLLGKKIPVDDEDSKIVKVENNKHFKSIYPKLMKAELLSFDYECTGLKPHAPGHVLTTVSACDGDKSYAWMNNPYRARMWKTVLENKKVKKSAHNLPFENMWSRVMFKAVVEGWFWDSLVNAHILDNRKAICGLKFQTYINFGVPDYDSLIAPYLKSDQKKYGANGVNRLLEFIKKYGDQDVLHYCGLDSLFGFKLTMKQMSAMGF